ncbi:MAG TPA: hypothetical protein VGE07_03965 [Herpetosiphonaceae bacterium]
MGASGWAYRVPYQQDIQRALDELRQLVFEHGAFLKGDPWWRDMEFAEFLPPEDLDAAELAEYRVEFDRLQALEEPTTIQEWIDWNGEEGTNSILDVDRVVAELPPVSEFPASADEADQQAWFAASSARFGTVSPLTGAEAMAILGTDRPTYELVLERLEPVQQLRDKGAGVYVVVFDGDAPAEIVFTGFSGD